MEQMMFWLFFSSIVLLIYIVLVLLMFIFSTKIDAATLVAMTGSLGQGKTLNGVNFAIKSHKKMLWLWTLGFIRENYKKSITLKLFKKTIIKIKYKPRKPKPLFYSNIPVKFKYPLLLRLIKKYPKFEWSKMITYEHLIQSERIYEYSTILLDEVSMIIDQHKHSSPFIKQYIGDFIRFYRHYIDGKLIVTAQSSSEIVKDLRVKLNTIYNLYEFKRAFIFFFKVKVQTIMVTEDVITVKDSENDEDIPYLCGHLPFKWFKFLDIFTFFFGYKKYDSRCYSPRYDHVKHKLETAVWEEYKTKYIIVIPDNKNIQQVYKQQGFISREQMEREIEQFKKNVVMAEKQLETSIEKG